MDKIAIRNRRASAAYRRRLREAAAPTARDAAAAILDALVDQAARAGRSSFTPLVATLVERGFDAEASARMLAGLVARRVEALRDTGHMAQC